MNKAKTNALDALRALIAERQQYEEWIEALETRRDTTPEHVFERVKSDYAGRLDRVVREIEGHAEELQLSISTLSSRLVEVAREEDTRREGLQEAELRAAVGEYQPEQWEQIKSDAERELEKIAADRASIDAQLSELRAIQKLSVRGSRGAVAPELQSHLDRAGDAAPSAGAPPPPPSAEPPVTPQRKGAEPEAALTERAAAAPERVTPAAPAAAARQDTKTGETHPRQRTGRTPAAGTGALKSRSEAPRPDSAKTLKCPECGTANYPTEWYCERCGGELATM